MTPKKKLPRGVFLRSGLYWIRFQDGHGKIRREKVGPYLKQAVAAYQKRKSEVREGTFFPRKVTRRVVRFAEIAADFLKYSENFKRSYPDDVTRMAILVRMWGDLPVESL